MVDQDFVRLILSVNAANNTDTSHVDVKMIFLEGKLYEKIKQSLLAALDKDTEAQKMVVDINAPAGDVVQLCRILYSLKQGVLNWYKEVHAMITRTIRLFLLFLGIFYVSSVAVLTWVDDFLIARKIDAIKGEISVRFNLKDIDTSTHFICRQIL